MKSSILGKRIEELWDLDKQIDDAEDVVKELKLTRKEIEDKLLKKFKRQEIDGLIAKRCKASIKHGRYPSIADRPKFFKYVRVNKAFDLFQSRVNSKAYFARLNEGEQVPGVKVFDKFSISLRARTK